jgi:hypothetical protein
LQLQHLYGNRAAQRLLENPSIALQRQERDRPVRIAQRLQQQDVIINTVGTPEVRNYGAFTWLVDYRLPQTAAGDGYIIQECWHTSTNLTTGEPLRPEWHYFEAWRVRAGASEPVERGGDNCHDRYSYVVLTPGGNYVENRIRGMIRFYETPVFPWGNDHPRNNPQHSFFHDLPQPPIWNGSGVRHEAVGTYDARSGRASNRLLLINGTQETRLGDWPSSIPRRGSP